MTNQEPKAYRFVGTETERVDPLRYERALRAWTDFLLQHVAEERAKGRPTRTG